MKLYGNSDKNSRHSAPEHAAPPPESRQKPPRKGRGLRRAAIVLAVILVVIASLVIGYAIWEKPPEVISNTNPTPGMNQGQSGQNGSSQPGSQPDGEDPIEVDEFDGALVTDRNDGVYTFLLVGRDHESNSTDTIIAGKFDTVNHTIDLVNIPRDTLVNVSWASTPKKINAIYPGYTNSGKSGIDGLRTHVKNLTGFDVDFYAVVNLRVVEDVIDEIGGVYFDVPIDMDYDDYGQSFHVHLKAGYQKLTGYQALGVFRFRYGGMVNGVPTQGYPGGDVQRIGVQQDLLKAIASQLLTLGNIPNLSSVIQLAVDNVETTLDASNMAFFARQFLKCSMEDINFHVAPVDGGHMINGVSFVSLKTDEWLEMVNQCLNPFKEEITLANVNILTASDYYGTSMSSTTGTIAGGYDSFYCQMCTAANMAATWHAPGACPDASAGTDDPVEGGEESGGEDNEEPAPPPDEGGTDPAPEETPVVEEIVLG